MDKLKQALKEAFPNIDFEHEQHLVDDGLLDSMSIVNIVSIIEDMFDVTVTMEYIQPMYFQSVQSMWEMIQELS